ncbi:MAG: cytochrome c [Candidatus Cybelea sp.]|jgi:cbb3-type cytochrome c oxidase subunit III
MPKRWTTLALLAAIATSLWAVSIETRATAGAATNDAAVAGQKIYGANCSACHGATGAGMAGEFPPLAGNPMVTGSPDKVIAAVKNGLSGAMTVNGKSFSGAMPAWKGKLSNTEIADVITYIRSAWSNKADPVTEAQVEASK